MNKKSFCDDVLFSDVWLDSAYGDNCWFSVSKSKINNKEGKNNKQNDGTHSGGAGERAGVVSGCRVARRKGWAPLLSVGEEVPNPRTLCFTHERGEKRERTSGEGEAVETGRALSGPNSTPPSPNGSVPPTFPQLRQPSCTGRGRNAAVQTPALIQRRTPPRRRRGVRTRDRPGRTHHICGWTKAGQPQPPLQLGQAVAAPAGAAAAANPRRRLGVHRTVVELSLRGPEQV